MNFEEFIRPDEKSTQTSAEKESADVQEFVQPEELDVQKAVVESLAADKVMRDEEIRRLKEENGSLRRDLQDLSAKNAALMSTISEMKSSLEKVGEVLAKNSEGEMSSKIALLDRNIECEDRFPGETRDHVLEVIKEARDRDEADGRVRRAQLLESVLVANEPNGTLTRRRAELEKLFNDNGNILSGLVIEELKKLGISHKKGEEYLLPSEIIKRTY